MANVSRRTFLQTASAATASGALRSAARAASPTRRNVLFIAVDDQNTRLGCYGTTAVKTPNLDALAARGTRFASAYCQFPLCGPSRASLMTGLAPDKVKVWDLQTNFRQNVPDVITLPQLFRKNGYYAARVGKIYHAGVPEDIGHNGEDDPASWEYVYNPCGVDHTREEPLVTNFTPTRMHTGDNGLPSLGSTISFHESPAPDNAMTDSLGADEVIRLLREKKDDPFFIAYGLYRPHVPWIVPKKYFDLYPLASIEAKTLEPGELLIAPPAAYWTQPPNFGMTELQCRTAIRAYYASTSFMDAQVGRVLRELKSLGLERNTIVVFWADHGWSLGEHGQWMKQTLFEPSAHVPLIFAGPGTGRPGSICTQTVEHLDTYPTLAELCGLQDVPHHLDGASLTSLMRGEQSGWNRPAVTQVCRPTSPTPKIEGYSLRTERYRYSVWGGAQTGEELYDYHADPGEKNNLAANLAYSELKQGLRKQLESITAKRGRSMSLGDPAGAGATGKARK